MRAMMQEQRDEIEILREEIKQLQAVNISLIVENKELQAKIAELNIRLSKARFRIITRIIIPYLLMLCQWVWLKKEMLNGHGNVTRRNYKLIDRFINRISRLLVQQHLLATLRKKV
jgi:uncharacterized membrane protein (DUF106 family)